MSEFKNIFQTYKRTTLLCVVTVICWMCEVSLFWLARKEWILHILPLVLPFVVMVGLAIDYDNKN